MKLLFYISKLYSLPVVEPIIKEASHRNVKIQISLFLSKKVEKKLPDYFKQFPIYTSLEEAIDFYPDFVLCPGNFVDFRLPGIKVELFHGIGIEKPSHYKIRHFFDVYFTSGPIVTSKFKKIQKKHKYFRVVETGWPKIDHIINFDTKNLKEKYNIPKNKKVILYAPTHSTRMQSASDLIPVFKTCIKDDEFWICKPHEFLDKTFIKEMKRQGIRLLSTFDITPYLHIADVMISDTSSVIYEFMLLNKPVITYRTLANKNKGLNIEIPEELRNALDRSLNNPDEFSKIRSNYIKKVNPVVDGTISSTILSQLQKWFDTPFKKRRKPLNLYRKMQILYHSRFKKGYLR